jgi:hypothetical protein
MGRFECFECARPAKHAHHVVPVNLGGKRTIPLCVGCHSKVHNMKAMAHPEAVSRGRRAAQARGVKFGHPKAKVISIDEVLALRSEGYSVEEISSRVGLGRSRLYELLARHRESRVRAG